MTRRVFLVVALAVLLVAWVALPSFAWKFVAMADSRGSNNGVNTTVLTQVINQVNKEGAELVLFGGDAVSGSSTSTTFSSQMDNWLSVMRNLNCPWYFTPGNHEVTASSSESILRSKIDMPLNGPSGYEETVFSFDNENAHFVFLNSNHYNEFHHVQRSWLQADLAKTTQTHVFVMTHEPAYPAGPHIGSSLDVYPTERNDLWNIMDNGRVNMFFAGHEHLYQRTTHGDIYQVITGSCGAPLHTGYSGTTASYNYVVVDINGNDVTCQTKNENGVVIDSWSYSVTPVPEPSGLLVLACAFPLVFRRICR